MSVAKHRYLERELEGWGRYPRHAAHVYRPEHLSSFSAILDERSSKTFIARGLGRSYGDAALNLDQGVIVTERLNCFLGFDESAGVLTCESGVTLPEIHQVCLPKGWFLPVTPGTKYATVGGCIAADVHGKNHHVDGSFSNHVRWLELLLADGSVIRCSPSENPELFWATSGGMGLTGIILRACLQMRAVETAYVHVDYQRTRSLEETLHYLDTEDESYTYSVSWVDTMASGKSMGRAVLMRGNHCRLEDLERWQRAEPLLTRDRVLLSIPFDLPAVALNAFTIRCLNSIYYRLFKEGESSKIQHYDTFFYPLDAVSSWNRAYGRRGFLQYQCALPPETARSGLEKILKRIVETGNGSFLAVLKRFGAEDGLISFPMPGYTLALDFPMRGPSTLAFLEELDSVVLEHGGRLYLAKDARMHSKHMPLMYPRFPEWLKIRRRADPSGLFSSDLSRRLALNGEAL